MRAGFKREGASKQRAKKSAPPLSDGTENVRSDFSSAYTMPIMQTSMTVCHIHSPIAHRVDETRLDPAGHAAATYQSESSFSLRTGLNRLSRFPITEQVSTS